jgi:hypothetical protein
MAAHKLADGPITLTVSRLEAQIGNFGPQFQIFGTADELVYVSEKSTLSGLARLNMTTESVVGQTIRIEQVKKDGKTFTNIHKVGAGEVPSSSSSPSPASSPSPVAKLTLPELAAIYSDCVSYAMATLGAKCEAAEITFTAADIAAAAATLFIRSSR